MADFDDRNREPQTDNPEVDPKREKNVPGRDDESESRRGQEYPRKDSEPLYGEEGSPSRPGKPSGEELPEAE